MSDKTICWRCDRQYFFEAEKCPECGAINANFDYGGATAQMLSEMEVAEEAAQVGVAV